MNANRSKHHISGLMALVLFGVFAACILAVLLGCTGVYQRLAQRGATSYDKRTAALYLATKVRQNDRADCIRVETFAGRDALVLSETMEDEQFETRIYCHDGYLCELFSVAGWEPAPEDGERLIPLQALQLQLEDDLLQIRITEAEDRTEQVLLCLRSGEVQP